MSFGAISALPRCTCCFIIALTHLIPSSTLEATHSELQEKKFFTREQALNNLSKRHLSQKLAVILDKAAKFGIQHLDRGRKINKLRRILDFEKDTSLPSVALYNLHVLYQSGNGPLKDKYFSVYAIKKQAGGTRFKLKSQGKRGRRSAREDSSETVCDQLSKEANCSKCGFRGICARGAARISPWLDFALTTQREIQRDEPVNHVQFLGAHNAFNNRASGYGDLDDCHWPIKADEVCISLANQEFSFTDQLNMGVRHLEIDLWNCFGKIRMSHGNEELKLGCSPWDKELTEGMMEIEDWTRKSRNKNEIILLFFDDHTTSHDDQAINRVIEQHVGGKVFTPTDLKLKFSGKWPSMKEMRAMKKTVIFIDSNDHAGRFLHRQFWTEGFSVKGFSPKLDNCSAIGRSRDVTRIGSDSTHYGPLWNGAKQTGIITNFKKYLLCGVNIPSADQISPELMKTAVFTWAEGEPKQPITESTCVILSGDKRWYVHNCAAKHYFACVSRRDKSHWSISSDIGKYSNPACPENMEFSIPHNGFQHQQLVQAARGRKVWINLTPFLSSLKVKFKR